MSSFDSIFSSLSSSSNSTPSLTSCLRLVLDEEVLQLLPHRIVAIRSAKRKKRILVNQATAANVGIGVDDAHFASEFQFLESKLHLKTPFGVFRILLYIMLGSTDYEI